MQQSTNLSSVMYYTVAGILLSLTLQDGVKEQIINFDNKISSEIIKYLSEVDGKVLYINKIKSSLSSLKEENMIVFFDVLTEETSDKTTFLINIPKSKDIQKIVDINMAIADIFDNIPENDREKFTTIQKMV